MTALQKGFIIAIALPYILWCTTWDVYVDNDQVTLNSTAWNDIPDMELNVSINSGEGCLVYFSASNFRGNPPYGAGDVLYFRILRDTVPIICWREWDRQISNTFYRFNTTAQKIDNPESGTHTYKVQFRCNGNYQGVTLDCANNAHRYFAVTTSPNFTGISETKPGSEIGTNLSLEIIPSITKDGAQIKFYLPVVTTITIKIIDRQGRVIDTLMKQKKVPSGIHSLYWNYKNDALPNGLYFVCLSTNSGTTVKKAIVIK